MTLVCANIRVTLSAFGSRHCVGGDGQDAFTGGTGADRFVFTASGSPAATPDQITDFNSTQGDRVDLSALGITAAALTITHGSGNAYTASLDVNNDNNPDFLIAVQSASH